MTQKFLSKIAAIEEMMAHHSSPVGMMAHHSNRADQLGELARGLRWQPPGDEEDLQALITLGMRVMGKRGGLWEVERAVYEILCDHAQAMHKALLLKAFNTRGAHGDDRRRLALQGLSRIAALTGDEAALEALEAGLSHSRADTRGWAIGFTIHAYGYLDRPLAASVIERLRAMAESDASPKVRVEAANALLHH